MLSLLGIALSLGLLMYLAYRGINVLILAPILALLAVFLASLWMTRVLRVLLPIGLSKCW